MTAFNCAQCGAARKTTSSAFNRAQREGKRLFCDRACAALGRRDPNPPTDEEKRAAKAAYDDSYREKNADVLREKKADYFQRTYDPDVAREERKAKMPAHLEYCRTPEYRKKKTDYDRWRRCLVYGEFAMAKEALLILDAEVKSRATFEELQAQKGTVNKSLTRRRAYEAAERL